jgi:hypothetical protein
VSKPLQRFREGREAIGGAVAVAVVVRAHGVSSHGAWCVLRTLFCSATPCGAVRVVGQRLPLSALAFGCPCPFPATRRCVACGCCVYLSHAAVGRGHNRTVGTSGVRCSIPLAARVVTRGPLFLAGVRLGVRSLCVHGHTMPHPLHTPRTPSRAPVCAATPRVPCNPPGRPRKGTHPRYGVRT